MDMDENDLMYTNQYLTQPDNKDISPELNDEFKKFYEKEVETQQEQKIKNSLDRISLIDVQLDEATDSGNLLNTNVFSLDGPQNENKVHERKIKEKKTLISVDSRDRDKTIYPKPSHFKIFLNKTFGNVKSVKLTSMEFPNTNAVINSTNNKIYWINKSDIDDDIIDTITKTYPVYSVELRIGSYIASTLQTEITNKLNVVKRDNKIGDFHYFAVSLDIDTDIVSGTSLLLKQLSINSLSVTSNATTVTVSLQDHGFETNDIVYMIGAKTVSGIGSETLNGAHSIVKITDDVFQYEVNVKASETAVGGGNVVKAGTLAPFKFLFGDYSNTIAQNVGFPLENSSERITAKIESAKNVIQLTITTTTQHNFQRTYDYIGQRCTLSNTGNASLNGLRLITNIIDQYSFTIAFSSKLGGDILVGDVTFGLNTFSVSSITNYSTDTILITTFSDHNYEVTETGQTVSFTNISSVPDINSTDYSILSIVSPTEFIILGSLLDEGQFEVSNVSEAGMLAMHNPIRTHTKQITGITTGFPTRFTCPGHGLLVGDKVKFYNVVTIPSLIEKNSAIYEITAIPNSDEFDINFSTTSYDIETINNGNSYIGTGLISLSFPYHGFNKIVSIDPGSPVTVDILGVPTLQNTIDVTTFLPHNYTVGQNVRLRNTGNTGVDSRLESNGAYSVYSIVNTNTFRVVYSAGLSSSILGGDLGMSNDFTLYSINTLGGITADSLNNKTFTIRDIVDLHNITFMCQDFAKTTEKGGGDSVYVSSLLHGFNGVQTNTKNSLLNRSINLEGENYAFMCCPQLSTVLTTSKVENIFARITLDQSPGTMVFSFMSNPKEFDTVPLDKLNELEFSIINWDNTYYEFYDLDYSFTLEIVELIDGTHDFNYSSRRGVTMQS